MLAETRNGECEACHAAGALFLWVREVPDSIVPQKEIEQDAMSVEEEQVKEERKEENVTVDEIAQLRERVERLERYFKENHT